MTSIHPSIMQCQMKAKGKNVVTSDVSAWFEWVRKQRIVLAMSGSVVFTPDGDVIEVQEMMRRYPLGTLNLALIES